MVLRMMYILPMLLGRTYDARKDITGPDIFSSEDIKNAKIIPETYYYSTYKTIESSSDVEEMMDISGDISLKIKAGKFAVRGTGDYIRESSDTVNSVDVLTKVDFYTYSLSLPSSAKPIENWSTIDPEQTGTHYVQSIIYGGELIARLRFEALKAKDLEDIRGTVKMSLEAGSAFDLVGEGKLEMLKKKLEGKARLAVSFYSTVPLRKVPNTIEGLRDLVNHFEDHVKQVNNGWGVPLQVILNELSAFNTKYTFLKNSALQSELFLFEESFNDLLKTKSQIKTWMVFLQNTVAEEQLGEINDLYQRISKTLKIFHDVIAKLDIEKGMEQLDPAVKEYRENGKSRLPGKFEKEFVRLKKKTDEKVKIMSEKHPSVYIHYGKAKCSSVAGTVTLLSGYLASSPRMEKGNGANYICLPKQPQLDEPAPVASSNRSSIRGIKYGLMEDSPFGILTEDIIFGGVVCSICMARERLSVLTFYNKTSCPGEEEWQRQYSGYVMSTINVNRGQFICVDEKPEYHKDSYMDADDQSLIMAMSGIRPENETKGKLQFIPCVVCSK